MSHQERTPSVHLLLEIELFNKMLTVLELNKEYDSGSGSCIKYCERLIDKLLTYSIPKTDENGETYVDVRFFPREAREIIGQLLVRVDMLIIEDYYSKLLEYRNSIKK